MLISYKLSLDVKTTALTETYAFISIVTQGLVVYYMTQLEESLALVAINEVIRAD